MSATITLKNTMARSTDAALNFIQHFLVIAALLIVIGIVNVFAKTTQPFEIFQSPLPDISVPDESNFESVLPKPSNEPAAAAAAAAVVPAPVTLSPGMQSALDYVARRYRVSSDALVPIFIMAQTTGKERRIDPLLIVAIIAIESRFNPFAESPFGAQGLMQVMPRFHKDKVPHGSGDKPFLDPAINIIVGVHILDEAIRRSGGLIPGLQHYAGSSDPESGYASKVLAEKGRLEQAHRKAGTGPGPGSNA